MIGNNFEPDLAPPKDWDLRVEESFVVVKPAVGVDIEMKVETSVAAMWVADIAGVVDPEKIDLNSYTDSYFEATNPYPDLLQDSLPGLDLGAALNYPLVVDQTVTSSDNLQNL